MDGVSELLKQGGLGLTAAIFLWLYLNERNENRKLYQKLLDAADARTKDANDNLEKVVKPMSAFSQTVSLIYEKLKLGKEQAQ